MSTVAKNPLPRMPVAPPLPKAPPITRAPAIPPLAPPVVIPPQAREEQVCEWCKEAIAKDAVICPHCKCPRLGAAKFLGAMAVVIAVLLFAIAAINLKGISDEKAARTVEYTSPSSSEFDFFGHLGEPLGEPSAAQVAPSEPGR